MSEISLGKNLDSPRALAALYRDSGGRDVVHRVTVVLTSKKLELMQTIALTLESLLKAGEQKPPAAVTK
jgi:intein/homing endonuclease